MKIVVDDFHVEDAKGKKVHIFDQLDTRVTDDDILKHLIASGTENLILKVQFKETDSLTKKFFSSAV